MSQTSFVRFPTDYVPAKILSEFLTWAKQKGHVSFGRPSISTSAASFRRDVSKHTGINAIHVPFRGAAQTIPAMLAGDVNFAIDNLASYVPVIQSGKMRALRGDLGSTLADVTRCFQLGEAGISDFVVTSWAAYVLPAGTPRPIIDRLSAAQQKIAAEPAVQERFLVAGARILSKHAGGGSRFRCQGPPLCGKM